MNRSRVAHFAMLLHRRWPVALALFLSFTFAHAEVPSVDFIFPAGGKVGASNSVSIGGKIEPWPLQVWTDSAALSFKADEAKGKFTVQIATNAPLGPHLVRFYNQDGASAPRCFVVGQLAEQDEKEPNDSPDKAQLIEKLPVTINGRLEKSGDADSFAVNLKAGQWLIASVDAYSLDAPLDPVLQLLDSHGTKIALNHDGRSLDPFLAFQAKEAGHYILQLFAFAYPPQADIKFTGGNAAVYRLTLSAGPFAKYSFPAGIPRGRRTTVHLFGWNLGTTGQAIVQELDASGLNPSVDAIAATAPGVENTLPVSVGDGVEEREIEPNDARDLAQTLSGPGTMNGRIDPAGDEDRFVFRARKGEAFRFQVRSATLGFPLDAVLRVEDSSGKELARNDDDGGVPDPELNWSAPADGSYCVALSDLLKRGGGDYVYRLELRQPAADFRGFVDGPTFRLEPGKTVELKVNVTRIDGFNGRLNAVADGLPEGVASTTASVPSKSGEVKLTLSASPEAKPANQPFRVLVLGTDSETPRVRVAQVKLKGQNAAAGGLLINQTDQIWLTVLPKPPPPKTEAKPEPEKKQPGGVVVLKACHQTQGRAKRLAELSED